MSCLFCYTDMFVYLLIYLFIHLLLHLFIYLFIYLFIHSFIYIFILLTHQCIILLAISSFNILLAIRLHFKMLTLNFYRLLFYHAMHDSRLLIDRPTDRPTDF